MSFFNNRLFYSLAFFLTLGGSLHWQMVFNNPLPLNTRTPQSEIDKMQANIIFLNQKKKAESCNCITSNPESKAFQTESLTQCSSARHFFENTQSKIPTHFRVSRSNKDFPRECMIYVMNSLHPSGEKASSMFAQCKPGQSAKRGYYKPCVTDTYVNVIHNSFTDMSSCMGIDPKFLVPKISNESGFHLNAYGRGHDGGIGQLTGVAIEEANKNFDGYKRHVFQSTNPACLRVRPLLELQRPISPKVSRRCDLMMPPHNPGLNLFYMMVKYQQDLRAINAFYTQLGIDRLVAQAGIKSQIDETALKDVMLNLAYNAGAGGSMLLLREYLQMRIEAHKKKRGPPLRAQDFDIDSGSRMTNTADWNLSFGHWLKRYQKTGSSGYLSVLKSHAERLDKAFQPGSCTVPNYLKVSMPNRGAK